MTTPLPPPQGVMAERELRSVEEVIAARDAGERVECWDEATGWEEGGVYTRTRAFIEWALAAGLQYRTRPAHSTPPMSYAALLARCEGLEAALREVLELRQATQDGVVTDRHELDIVRDARSLLAATRTTGEDGA